MSDLDSLLQELKSEIDSAVQSKQKRTSTFDPIAQSRLSRYDPTPIKQKQIDVSSLFPENKETPPSPLWKTRIAGVKPKQEKPDFSKVKSTTQALKVPGEYLDKALKDFDEGHVASGVLGLAEAGVHTVFSAATVPLGMIDDALRGVGLSDPADALNFVFDLPARGVREGQKLIDAQLSDTEFSKQFNDGMEMYLMSKGISPEEQKKIKGKIDEASQLLATVIVFEGGAKLKPKKAKGVTIREDIKPPESTPPKKVKIKESKPLTADPGGVALVNALERKAKASIQSKTRINDKAIAEAVGKVKDPEQVKRLEKLYMEAVEHNKKYPRKIEKTKTKQAGDELKIENPDILPTPEQSGDILFPKTKVTKESNKLVEPKSTSDIKNETPTKQTKVKIKSKEPPKVESPKSNIDFPKGSNAVKVEFESGRKSSVLKDDISTLEGINDPIKKITYGKVDYGKDKTVKWDTFKELGEKPKSAKEDILSTIFELQQDRKSRDRVGKMDATRKIKKEVEQLRALGIDANYKAGKLTIDGKEVRPPKKMPKLKKPEDVEITNKLASKPFDKLPKREVENQKRLVQFIEPEMLPDGIGKKATEKGIRDVLNGNEMTKEAQIVRDQAKWIEKHGYTDRTTKREITPEEIKDLSNQKKQDLGPQEELLFSKGKKKEEAGGKGNSEPVKVSQIIQDLRDDFGIPIRVGKMRQKKEVLGIYKTNSGGKYAEVIRLKEADDLATASHEVAHHIDKKVFSEFYRTQKSKILNEELKKLDYDQTKQRKSEGFAEFVRHYITEKDAMDVAPNFYKFFTEEFLPKHPEIAKNIEKARSNAQIWYDEGALARSIARMSFTKLKKGASFKTKLERGFVNFNMTAGANQLAGLEWAVNKTTEKTGKLRPSEDPAKLANAVAKSGSAKARHAVLDGFHNFAGDKVGKSLREVFEPISSKDINEFGFPEYQTAMAYAYAKHAKSSHERGINPGLSLADAEFILQNVKKPKYEQFSKDFTEFSSNLLDYFVDAGGLTKEAATRMREANPFYIPLKRVMDDVFDKMGSGKGLVDLSSPYKGRKGSGRDIQNPLEQMIQMTEQIISSADKVRVGRALAELEKKYEGLGGLVEKLPPPSEKVVKELKDLKTQIEKAGGDLSEADLTSMVDIFSQGRQYYGKDNIVSIVVDGKRQFYELDPLLHRSMKGLDPYHLPAFLEWTLGKPTKAIRLGATGIRAGFSLITNPIRDAQTFALQSEYAGARMDKIGKALFQEAFGRGKNTDKFRAAGGETAQPLGIDRKHIENAVNEVLANDKKSKALNIVEHPVEALRKILSFPEAGVRMAEFNAVWEKYQPKIDKALAEGDLVKVKKLKEDAMTEGLYSSNEVTVNFKRMSQAGKFLNQVIPFYNPAIQGTSRMGRTIYNHPLRSGLRAGALLTAPTIMLWMVNKDKDWYKELPKWQKYGFWNFESPFSDDIIRLPKPFEWGYLFAGIPEAVANSIYEKDPNIAIEGVEAAVENIVPPIMPGAIKPAAEVYFNWDMFRKRPIVSPTMEDIEASQQFTPFTTPLAKKAGELGREFTMWSQDKSVLGVDIGMALNISPLMVDHLLSGYTGGLAKDIANGLPKNFKESADIPVVGRLFTRQSAIGFSGESVKEFYDMYEEMQKVLRTATYAEKHKRGRVEMTSWERFLKQKKEKINIQAERLVALRERQNKLMEVDMDRDVRNQFIKTLNEAASKTSRMIVKELKKGYKESIKNKKAEVGDKIFIEDSDETENILREE